MKMQPWKTVLVVVGCLPLAGICVRCGGNESGGAVHANQGALPLRMPLPAGWSTHFDTMGFGMHVPPGWTVKANTANGRVEVTGTDSERVTIWPLFLKEQLSSARAGAIQNKLSTLVLPQTQWAQIQSVATGALKSTGRDGSSFAVSLFRWTPSPRGTAAIEYIAAAAEDRFADKEDTLAKVLASFELRGSDVNAQAPSPQGGNAGRNIPMETWDDPIEHAFTMQMPKGWKIEGGTYRTNAIDPHDVWVASSPDGAFRLWSGDKDVPGFIVPNQSLATAGANEGSWYSPGYNTRVLVSRYLPGKVASESYVSRVYSKRDCEGLQVGESKEREDLEETARAAYNAQKIPGIGIQVDIGETLFSCTLQGKVKDGVVLTSTVLSGNNDVQQWFVDALYGVIAPQGQIETARNVMLAIVESRKANAEWTRGQQQTTAATSNIVTNTNNAVSNTIIKGHEDRSRINDEIGRRRSNATLGVLDVTDPETGKELKVESSSNYYWIDHRGTIVGTDVDTRPAFEFRELIKRP